MAQPREIDQALVDAYLARRALDYLVGFTLSPVLWRKLPGSALRRARAIGSFGVSSATASARSRHSCRANTGRSWATLATQDGAQFEARLVGAGGKKITRLDIGTGEEAEAFKRDLDIASFNVAKVEAKPAKPPIRSRHSPPRRWQQEASRKLGMAPAQTMRIAQRLYEGTEIGGEDGRPHHLYANRRRGHGSQRRSGRAQGDRA